MKALPLMLCAALISGCATVRDPATGQTRQELTPAGQVAIALLAIGALAAIGSSEERPSRTYVTTYADGTQSKTEVYDR